MIQFFYSLDYDDSVFTEPENSNETPVELLNSALESSTIENQGHSTSKLTRTSILNNALVYAMADKYQVKWLKDRAMSKTWYILTDAFELNDYCQAIETVWTTTPPSDIGLRTVYLQIFLVRRAEILKASKAETKDLWTTNDFLQSVIRAEAEASGLDESDLALSKRGCCPRGHQEDIKCSGYCGEALGITFKLRHNKPQTAMFSEC